MKPKVFKYLFFIITILLIAISVYIIYKDKSGKSINISTTRISNIKKTEIKIGVVGYDTINPILSKNRNIQFIDKLIFDSLITISKDFKVENSLAKEYSKINNLTYLIKLRDDIYWNDNVKFTAKDVKFTIDNLKNLPKDSIYKENVKNIENVEIIDENTIKIYLTMETSFFEYMMCFPILAEHSYENGTLESKTAIPIGTGKYKILTIETDKIEISKSNPDLDLNISSIDINIYNSFIKLYKDFLDGKIDLINTNNIDYEKYIGTMGYNKNIAVDRTYSFIAINTKKDILSYKEVRQAINYAINRQNIIYNVFNNKYNIANFPLDFGSFLYKEENAISDYDINKAKNILIENNWTYKNDIWKKEKTNEKLELNLIVKAEELKKVLVAELIKEELEDIGIKINLIKVNKTEYESYIKNKSYDLILAEKDMAITPDLEYFLGDNNLSNYYNEKVKEILGEIITIENEGIKNEKYKDLINIYKGDMPFISLYFNSNFTLYNSNLRGDMSHNWYNIFYNIENWYRE